MNKLKYIGLNLLSLRKAGSHAAPSLRYLYTSQYLRTTHDTLPTMTVCDINAEEMMVADDDLVEEYDRGSGMYGGGSATEPQVIDITPTGEAVSSGVGNMAPIAPVDINGWEDEEEMRDGTVDYEVIEKMKRLYELPPIPKERSGIYEFKGIKITLPQRMLTPATYKYRLTEDDENVPDDTRICQFEPKPGVPVNKKPTPKPEASVASSTNSK